MTMITANVKRAILSALCLVLCAGCSQGDTDGDGAADHAQNDRPQYVSDGGAGATLKITIKGDLSVGDQVPFTVIALDPQGNGIPFIRIFCESEKGVAIIEPSSGGVAFENTNSTGLMSGVLGGLTPGSYIMECRAPEGFNLVTRQQVKVSGSVPAGFQGFPGAAGGNLGGGLLVDQTPGAEDPNGVRITNVLFYDGGNTTTATTDIDIQVSACTDAEQEDKNFFTTFKITVANPLPQDAIIDSVDITVNGASTTVSLGGCTVAAQDTADCSGPFADYTGTDVGTFNNTGKTLVGSHANEFVEGTFAVGFTLNFTLEDGSTGSSTSSTSETFGSVDACQ